MNGKATPSLGKAIGIADLFQISTDRLMGADFVDLLEHELADPERAIWTVRGAGDGRPTHDGHLKQMWGRAPSPEDGDVLGLARWIVLEGRGNLDELVERRITTRTCRRL
jgi:hypothetical protein